MELDFPIQCQSSSLSTESFPFRSRLLSFSNGLIKQRLKVEGGISCGPGGMQELFMNRREENNEVVSIKRKST